MTSAFPLPPSSSTSSSVSTANPSVQSVPQALGTLPPPSQPEYELRYLYLYPFFQTRGDYEKAFGAGSCPAFNPNKPPKHWLAPKPTSYTPYVTFNRCLAVNQQNIPMKDPDGNPLLIPISVPYNDVDRVNIPPDSYTGVPGGELNPELPPEIPCPLRALLPKEQLVFTLATWPVVRNIDLYNAQMDAQPGFQPTDRERLKRIEDILSQLLNALKV